MFLLKKKSKILTIKPGSFIIEDESLVNKWNKKKIISLRSYLEKLDRASLKIENWKIIFLNLEELENLSWALVLEIARHIKKLLLKAKKNKIPSFSYLKKAGLKEYYLACLCETISLNPIGEINFFDFQFEQYFYKKTLSKIGVEADFIKTGNYKTFADKWTSDSISKPHSRMLLRILSDFKKNFTKHILNHRPHLKSLEKFHEKGLINPHEAKKIGLVDCIFYKESLEDFFKKKFKLKEVKYENILSLKKTISNKIQDLFSKKERIAILYANGIILEKKEWNPLNKNQKIIDEKSFLKALKEIEKNDKIKGLIIRVNSPGGSAVTSDILWNLIRKIKRKKPVIVSMGDLAASGGYYISMGANYIFAENMTLTGSIGVIMGKFHMEDLFKKIGIKREVLSKSLNNDFMGIDRSFSEKQKKILKKLIFKYYYKIFLKKASLGRKISFKEIQKYAQGKVWTGKTAKKLKLVDKIGGLYEAFKKMKKILKLKEEKSLQFEIYPKRKASLLSFMTNGLLESKLIEMLKSYLIAKLDDILDKNMETKKLDKNSKSTDIKFL